MDLLSAYNDSDDEENLHIEKKVVTRKVNAAPDVTLTKPKPAFDPTEYKQKEVYWNPEFETLYPVPKGPIVRPHYGPGGNNVLTGFVADAFVDPHAFEEQYNTFMTKGYAVDPDNRGKFIGKVENVSGIETKPERRKRKVVFDPENINGFTGPWAAYDDELALSNDLRKASDDVEIEHQAQQQVEEVKKAKIQKEEEQPAKQERETIQAKSIFHGNQLRDYQGRSFVDPPSDLKAGDHECFLPKRWIHTWTGHTKGVQAIRFFPKYGHLMLSSSFDTKVKIWDVYNKMQVIRTYIGHTKAVRDVAFSPDGRRFVSAGLDKQINLWDTETGECIGSYTSGKLPFVVKFHPSPDKGNLFLAGCQDKKIVQYDVNSGKIVQEYDQHLGAINTITFIENGKRFITTADDKSIRVWEFGIPVVIKYISEPHMHAMPSVALHPNGKWFIAQSMDNQIMVYSTTDKFRQHKKKVFSGHLVAGYACQVGFSPDGRYVYSGDSNGNLWIWDWKSTKVLKTIKCHQGVCIDAQWHPIEPSKMATCGWDGTIKYWD